MDTTPLTDSILTFGTAREAAEACGARTFELLAAARKDHGVATLAVSGGSTPRIMFEWMAKRGFDWSGVQIFQVDERCFPPDHEQSNYRMLRESLLDPAQIPPSQVHRVQGELPPDQAARVYVDEIRETLHLSPGDLPIFDVIQRGMGPDGHTASLFPGEALIGDHVGLASSVWVEKMKQHRVTLLPGVLERGVATLCLVTGPDKAAALKSVLRGPFDPMAFPSQIGLKNSVWFTDSASTAELNRSGA
jgi:6-phosphogluconolactonase